MPDIDENTTRIADQLEALGNPTRLAIYRILVRAGDEGLPVGKIQDRLGVPGSTLTHHCKRLVAANLCTQERRATTLICRANYRNMANLIGYLVDECCADGSLPPNLNSDIARLDDSLRSVAGKKTTTCC